MSGVSQARQQHRVVFSGSPWSCVVVTSVHPKLSLSLSEGPGPFPSVALRLQRGGQGTLSLRPPHNEEAGKGSPLDFLRGLPELTSGFFFFFGIYCGEHFCLVCNPQSYLNVITSKSVVSWTPPPNERSCSLQTNGLTSLRPARWTSSYSASSTRP